MSHALARAPRTSSSPLREVSSPLPLSKRERDAAACLRSGLNVLVLGESGVGKTRLALRVAQAVGREPVVRATLGSSDDLNTITSELFGHEKGAFSGATHSRRGLVDLADGGTLILDEVLNLPKHAQHLLLDFAQFGTYRPLGHRTANALRADVRIIAATNGSLEEAMREGRFRTDLYHRLAGDVVRIAPLRERRHQIGTLARRILARHGATISDAAIARLSRADLAWDGNVRELESTLLRALVRANADGSTCVDSVHISSPSGCSADPVIPITEDLKSRLEGVRRARRELDRAEARILEESLRKWGGVVSRAARELDMKRTSLISRMQRLDVSRFT